MSVSSSNSSTTTRCGRSSRPVFPPNHLFSLFNVHDRRQDFMRSLSTTIFIYVFTLWLLFTSCVSGQQEQHPQTGGVHNDTTQLVCVPFGTCEPCPEDALHEPFCQPFGNRRLMHCYPASSPPPDSHSHPSNISHEPGSSHQGETPGWESCGRIVEKERADFYEFFACNLVIAAIAVFVVFARSRRLQAMQARQLAARIGLTRGTPGGWVNG
ncbi:unnamed protein product [Somion occarium]|uniref:Uncharacterized protein n=1 Tax=Somion occarium TaxID=3059160 RepID=A0ABP1DM80_9APHY